MALTNEKLVIVGAAGMIGSNMVQSALMMNLTTNICLYDVFSPEGVAEEMRQSGFCDANIVATTDVAEAFKDAKYIISSGGAPRKAGMTREDLLAGNCKIAQELGENIKKYCPDVKHVVIIFNPADLTGLVTLLYSGLKPGQVTTLAGLDSTRLQSALAKKFGVMQNQVTGAHTFGGHGEQMAVFGSAVKIAGKPLNDIIGTAQFPAEEWEQMKVDVT
jgi:malate dehydrogenase